MNHRIYLISALIGAQCCAASSIDTLAQVREACTVYLQHTQRATGKLLEFLRYFQKTGSRQPITQQVQLIHELYAADLMLLNKLNQLANNTTQSQTPQLFPNNNNNSAATRKIYQQAQELIAKAL